MFWGQRDGGLTAPLCQDGCGREGHCLCATAPLFVPIPGWFGTDSLAQLSAGCQSPVDCPAHPLGRPVPVGAVGQCKMEALPESQMNNSFGA